MYATSINKRKAELLLEYDQNNCLDRKRKLQMTGNEDVNQGPYTMDKYNFKAISRPYKKLQG